MNKTKLGFIQLIIKVFSFLLYFGSLTCLRHFQILPYKAVWNNNQSDEANQVLIIWLNYWKYETKICIKGKMPKRILFGRRESEGI